LVDCHRRWKSQTADAKTSRRRSLQDELLFQDDVHVNNLMVADANTSPKRPGHRRSTTLVPAEESRLEFIVAATAVGMSAPTTRTPKYINIIKHKRGEEVAATTTALEVKVPTTKVRSAPGDIGVIMPSATLNAHSVCRSFDTGTGTQDHHVKKQDSSSGKSHAKGKRIGAHRSVDIGIDIPDAHGADLSGRSSSSSRENYLNLTHSVSELSLTEKSEVGASTLLASCQTEDTESPFFLQHSTRRGGMMCDDGSVTSSYVRASSFSYDVNAAAIVAHQQQQIHNQQDQSGDRNDIYTVEDTTTTSSSGSQEGEIGVLDDSDHSMRPLASSGAAATRRRSSQGDSEFPRHCSSSLNSNNDKHNISPLSRPLPRELTIGDNCTLEQAFDFINYSTAAAKDHDIRSTDRIRRSSIIPALIGSLHPQDAVRRSRRPQSKSLPRRMAAVSRAGASPPQTIYRSSLEH
jgi:hypothetical protein